MRGGGLLTIACTVIFTTTACAPRQILPVRSIDPAPLVEAVQHRRSVLDKGVSGILEMNFKQGNRRFHGRAYVIAFPDGRFRLEIPGFMGSTLLIMTSDGKGLLAYYPGEGKAYRSEPTGRSLDDHLPFPLPVDAAMVPSLLLGVYPEGEDSPETQEASLLNSGEKRLQAVWGTSGIRFIHIFSGGDPGSLKTIQALLGDMKLEVTTEKAPPHLPRGFTLAFKETNLKGKWEEAALFTGNDSAVRLKVPESVPVIDLGPPP
jgi:hypothetical protein